LADWTVDEARAYLPRLRRLIELVRRAAVVSARARSNGHRDRSGAPDGAEGAGERPPADEAGAEEANAEAEELSGVGPAEALAEIEARGIVLRDLERGLVDFPSRHPSGREVLLCWQLGEPDLAWWHLPEDGFAGRRPLPLPPAL
jgi:hypothetical protein